MTHGLAAYSSAGLGGAASAREAVGLKRSRASSFPSCSASSSSSSWGWLHSRVIIFLSVGSLLVLSLGKVDLFYTGSSTSSSSSTRKAFLGSPDQWSELDLHGGLYDLGQLDESSAYRAVVQHPSVVIGGETDGLFKEVIEDGNSTIFSNNNELHANDKGMQGKESMVQKLAVLDQGSDGVAGMTDQPGMQQHHYHDRHHHHRHHHQIGHKDRDAVLLKQQKQEKKKKNAKKEKRIRNNDNIGAPAAAAGRQAECDPAVGVWVRDVEKRQLYNERCPEIARRWRCQKNGKPNAQDSLLWRWQPRGCNLDRLDPHAFLAHFSHKSIAFVGDSLGRNMYASLICSLRAAEDPEAAFLGADQQLLQQQQQQQHVSADKTKCMRFRKHNVTVCYYPSKFLVRHSRCGNSVQMKGHAGGEMQRSRGGGGEVDVAHLELDLPQTIWAAAPTLHDVLVLNTGHWWFSEAKLKEPVKFSEKGRTIRPHISIKQAYARAIQHMLAYVARKGRRKEHVHFFRTLAPHHFEGGSWEHGGGCCRTQPLNSSEVRDLFYRGPTYMNEQVRLANRQVEHIVNRSESVLLNVTGLSLPRADAHPGTYGRGPEDCMHWCLPGVVDVWNDMFAKMAMELI